MIVLDASAAVLALLNDGATRRLLATETVGIPHLADSEVAMHDHRRAPLISTLSRTSSFGFGVSA